MISRVCRLCCRFPWIAILIVGLLTVFMIYQVSEKAYFEADLIKFLPTDLSAVKSDDYSKKNFNNQDAILIGLENRQGTMLDPDTLRATEKIVLALKDLKASKTFYSKLAGKSVTLEQPVGIDPDSISSVANLEDAILDEETGSVIAGSVVAKLKKDLNIPSKPGQEERLPESDEDLARIIPGLKDRIMGDRNFRGSILSEDLHSASIRASTIRKPIYKRRYAILELGTTIDPQLLKSRFQGNDSLFPFDIYGKTIDGIIINDQYIKEHSQQVRQELKSFLFNQLQPVLSDEPELKQVLQQELTNDGFQKVMQIIARNDFFMNPRIGTWLSFIDDLYEFTLNSIDPFSLENLEFQIHDVNDVADLAEIYYLTNDILQKNQLDGMKSYVAGMPVVIGVFSQMMSEDMQVLIPIAILVVIVILVLSFRSVMGVFIPLITVVLAVIWTLGVMAILRVPFTVSTSGLPIIILAVGTAYGIHLLNRYYEDVRMNLNKYDTVQLSIKNVGGAIFMAAITTIAGFSSLATTSLTTIRHFGIFSAVGVVIALVLSITFTPALLVLWRSPKIKQIPGSRETFGVLAPIMAKWSRLVIRRPIPTLGIFLLLMLISLYLMRNNHFEGSIMSNFKEDNVIFKSDHFLNKNLTGTTDINLIFTFRDRINLENEGTQKELQKRITTFSDRLQDLNLRSDSPEQGLADQLASSLQKYSRDLPQSGQDLLTYFALMGDIFNEEYRVAPKENPQRSLTTSAEDMPALTGQEEADSLDDLADQSGGDLTGLEGLADQSGGGLEELAESADTGLGGLEDLADLSTPGNTGTSVFANLGQEQLAGIKEIHRRLGLPEESWQETAKAVVNLRQEKISYAGKKMIKGFNLLKDFLAVDIKQPIVLHKLEKLRQILNDKETPRVLIDGEVYKPTGLIVTPVDFVRKFYRVFYHDDKPAFDRLPDVEKDGFTDPTLTDRSIIGVVLNQAQNADRDQFEAIVTPDLKEFQVKIMIRDGSSATLNGYVDETMQQVNSLFPEDDPYIKTIRTGGAAFTGMQVSNLLGSSQAKSIVLSFLFVFVVTFFIFRSVTGGLFALLPLLFTVVLNFGFLAILGGEVTMTTMLVASVAIGTGVDYTIHFLERLKIQLRSGDDLAQAYINTSVSSGKAIIVNAIAVAAGFLVFLFSSFNSQIMMGVLIAATMLFSSLGALSLLPALILKVKPHFLEKVRIDKVQTQ